MDVPPRRKYARPASTEVNVRWLPLLAALALLPACPGFGDRVVWEAGPEPDTGVADGTVPEPDAGEDAAIDAGRPGWPEVEPIFIARCQGCHGSPPVGGAPFPLLTFVDVRAQLERVRVRTIELGDMPPGAPLPAAERELLATWIDAGGPR